MKQARRIFELEKKAEAAGDSVSVIVDDRQEHIDFVRWMRRVSKKNDKRPVVISPEEEKAFRPPFTEHHIKSELESRGRTITEWLRDAVKGGRDNGPN
jgi:hypothetical protein